jgi:long-chain fatty acid transport protein
MLRTPPLEPRRRLDARPRRAGARATLSTLALALGTLAVAIPEARGAGLYVADRGVRPLARAGAFVAGADDLGAIAYNPAGIFDAGSAMLLDGAYVRYSNTYTREAIVTQSDPNTGEEVARYRQTFAPATGETPFLPIPTLAVSFKPADAWVVALGLHAPYAAQLEYPQTIGGEPGAQRYALLSLKGSTLAIAGLHVAFAPLRELRIGASAGVLFGTFNATTMLPAGVPDRFFGASEDPDWDVLTELKAGPIVAPTGQLGVIWAPTPMWRVGLSGTLPTLVDTGGTIRTRLPQAAPFEVASIEGESVGVKFWLPLVLRLGVEVRPLAGLRVEVGGAYEAWSMHEKIEVAPKGVALKNVPGFPETYNLPAIDIERRFQDAFSVRAGGEYGFDVLGQRGFVRAGVSYESSAVPAAFVTALTPDQEKVTTALGVGAKVGPVRVDLTYARVFGLGVYSDPETAGIKHVRAFVANPVPGERGVNAGTYQSEADVVGLGLTYLIGAPPAALVQPEPGSSAPLEKSPKK